RTVDGKLGHPGLIVRFDLGEPVPILRPHMLVLPDAVGAEQPLEPGVEPLRPGAIVPSDPVDEPDDLGARPLRVVVAENRSGKPIEAGTALREALGIERGLSLLWGPGAARPASLPRTLFAATQDFPS